MIKKYIFDFLLLICMVISCGKDSSTKPETEINSAWEAFEKGKYDRALQLFQEAIAKDQSDADSYNGLGWTYARLGQLEESETNFFNCLILDMYYVDAGVGLAFIYNAQNEYELSIDVISQVLEFTTAWTFKHDKSLDIKDIYMLYAENYFAIAKYMKCMEQVQVLNANFSADINSQAGIAELAAEIERLRDTN